MPSVEHAGARIYYEVHGDGPAVVFAHGMGGNRVSWWQQVPAFAPRHRVVTFDHRSFGRSQCAPDAFHPKHFSGDLLAILDAEGIERAALVCQSMGGWTGLRTAIDRPERVACLALCGTPGGLLTPKVAEAAAQVTSGIQEGGVRGNLALAADFPGRHPQRAFLYDQINALNTGYDPAWVARFADEEARVLPEALEGFAVPTLVLSGSEDRLFPPGALAEVAAAIPGAELERFRGVGHSIYFEEPERFNDTIAPFVAKHLTASAAR